MSKLFIFITLFSFILSIDPNTRINLINVVPETDFIPLNSREITEFELNKTKSELYYSFRNNYKDSDIVINLKVGRGFMTYCYVYDSYEKIETDEKGDYINPLTQFTLTENSIILKSSEFQIKNTTYYFILKDIINSYNKDYISIFNEQDTILLQKEQILTINKFYSKNVFYILFSHYKNEVITLELNIDNVEFTQYIAIYSARTKEVLYMGEKNRGEIKLNEDLDEEGEYIILIESDEDTYTDIESSIILHKDDRVVKELKYGNPVSLSYTLKKDINFYADIDDYEYNDEGIVTFKFGNQVFDRNLLSHCYAKVINYESNDDNKFIANMPAKEDDNEAVFTRLTGTSDIYQLYFKKNKEKEENKKSFLLIHLSLKIEEHDPDEYISPEEFTAYLSDKPETIKLDEYKNTNNILDNNIKLVSYTPKIYKVILPKKTNNSDKLSYIFYTSSNIQVVYNDTMLNVDSHLYENSRMIYAISNNAESYDYINTLYIKLYGFSEKDIIFRAESNKATIYYIHNEYRKIKTFSDKLLDCSKSFYYIGDYGLLVEKGFLYNEPLYGKIDSYYKGKVEVDDKSILINEDKKYLVKDDYISLDTSLDIVEFKCQSPSFYQVHLLDEVDSRDINLYSRIYNYLPAGKNIFIYPTLNPLQEDINFEIYTPTGKEIKINDGKKETKIDSKNKYYQVKYKNVDEVPSCFTVLSTEDTIIAITLTNKNPFVIVDGEYAHADYDSQIVVKLPQNTDYQSVNVVITRIYHGYSYSIFRGNVDYASKLIESDFDYITIDKSHQINISMINPYLRVKNEDENNAFYIMFSIDDPEMIQKDVYVTYNKKQEYEIIEDGIPRAIFKENEKYSLPIYEENKEINIVYQSCGNSLKQILITNNGEEYKTIINGSPDPIHQLDTISLTTESDLQVSINFREDIIKDLPQLKGAIIGFSDQNITEDDIAYYNSLKLNISQNKKKVEWEPIPEVTQYDIYVLDENNSYVQYLNNTCLLQAIKNNELKIKNNDSYIKHYSSKTNSITLEEKGNYSVAVSANITGKIPLIYIYDVIIYDSSLVPPDRKDDDDDDDDMTGTYIFIGISFPLVLIVVILLLILLIRAKKDAVSSEESKDGLKEEEEQPIAKESTDNSYTE